MMRPSGPAALWLARHGESTANVAWLQAERSGAELIDIPDRDADVPLSEQGRDQAKALGRSMAGFAADQRPTLAVSSPYRRTLDTARIALAELGPTPLIVDERLRDRELGVLDLLTMAGVRARYPDEAARRHRLGKLYHRPPGGESWADVALRLRAVLTDLKVDHPDDRVVLFTHEAVIMLARYILDSLSEDELAHLVTSTVMPNCAMTRYERAPDGTMHLADFNNSELVDQLCAEPTAEPGVTSDWR